ncbi:hypothetical protein, partial [Roseobacter sp.]|uniref:hypothetical protein n=1 Tax=Roseobacter sp. TaxID=1907202 RepID=UPI0026014983
MSASDNIFSVIQCAIADDARATGDETLRVCARLFTPSFPEISAAVSALSGQVLTSINPPGALVRMVGRERKGSDVLEHGSIDRDG